MTPLVAAIISACLVAAPAQCERHEVRVEPRACRIAPIRAEVAINGAWTAAVVKIECGVR